MDERISITRQCGHVEWVKVPAWESQQSIIVQERRYLCDGCFFGKFKPIATTTSAYFGESQRKYEEGK